MLTWSCAWRWPSRRYRACIKSSVLVNEDLLLRISLCHRRRRRDICPEAQRLDEVRTDGSIDEAPPMKFGWLMPIRDEEVSSTVETPGALAHVLIPVKAAYKGSSDSLTPLPFLLKVLNDDKAPAAIKLKVASATMPYTHSKQSMRPPKPSAVADGFGFSVEPALARKPRNENARLSVLKKRRNPHPRDQKLIQKLHERIDATLAMLQCPCPSLYTVKQAKTDKEEIERLWRKRRSRRKITPHEDAVLAHVNARYTAFALGPEAKARARLRSLRAREKQHRGDAPLSPWEKGELSLLAVFYPAKILKLTPNYEEALERDSEFSTCKFDPRGFAVVPANFAPADEQSSNSPSHSTSNDDFEEFAPCLPFCAVDREMSLKMGRTVLKWSDDRNQLDQLQRIDASRCADS
jgi:hypothetical protein